MDRQTTVSYRRVSPATVTGLPPDFTLTDKVFDLSVAATEARDDTEFRFLQPVTVTVFLTGEEATAFNDSHSNVAIQRFDPDARKWIPLQTTIDLAARTAQVQILAPNSLALTVKKPVSSPERVLTYGPVLPQGYLGAGMVSLTIPKELGATNTARVSLRIALGDSSPGDQPTSRSGEGQFTMKRSTAHRWRFSWRLLATRQCSVHQRMSFRLDAPGFEMTPLGRGAATSPRQPSWMVLDNHANRAALGRAGNIGLGYRQWANLVHPENVGNGDSSRTENRGDNGYNALPAPNHNLSSHSCSNSNPGRRGSYRGGSHNLPCGHPRRNSNSSTAPGPDSVSCSGVPSCCGPVHHPKSQ